MNAEVSISSNIAAAWCEESLRDSLAMDLSRHVADITDLSNGKYFTLVKNNISEKELLEFQTGGKTSGAPKPDDWLSDIIVEFRKQRDSFIIIEDWYLKPHSGLIHSRSLPSIFHGNNVYHVVKDCDFSSHEYWKNILTNSEPLFHGFIVQDCPMPAIGSSLKDQDLKLIAKSVVLIFFGVYDGESYLVCSLR